MTQKHLSGFNVTLLAIGLALLAATVSLLSAKNMNTSTLSAAQNARSKGAWLDRPIVNWNEKSRELSGPPSHVDLDEIKTRCAKILREVETPYEREIVNAGWLVYGPVQSYGATKIVTGMSGADDLCHPLGYQAFVYIGNNYAGTLSPEAMDSSATGALMHIRIESATSIAAEFARYRQHDDPCCPSRISYVSYEASENDYPMIRPIQIITRSLCQFETEKPTSDTARLFEVKWRLTQIGAVKLTANNPYIKFERAARIFSGNSGCNQIAGGFEIVETSLSFKRTVRTSFVCLDPDAQQLEADLMKALEQVTRFELQDDALQLYDCGNLLLVFQAEQMPH